MGEKSNLRTDFISFEEYWDESNSYPMGILYISACLKREGFTNIGYNVHVCMLRKMEEKNGRIFEFTNIESTLERMTEERKRNFEHLFEFLKESQPHIILLGPVTSFYLVEVTDLVPRLRERFPEQLILAGGPHFGKDDSLDEELLESCRELDGIVVGEAEETIAEVVKHFYSESFSSMTIQSRLELQTRLGKTPGVHVRGRKLRPRHPPRLENLPSPDWDLLEKHLGEPSQHMFHPKYKLSNRRNPITWIQRSVVDSVYGTGATEDDVRYFNHQFASKDYRFPFGVIIGSRGCPYTCSFCGSTGNRRVHSARYVFDQIKDLNNRYGIRLYVFFDPLFTTSSPIEQKRIEELCKLICTSGLDIRYMIDIRVDIVLNLPEALLALMMQSGCVEVNLGLEKGSNRMLKKMTKGITTTDQRKAVAKLRRIAKREHRKIMVNGTFILGGPEETKYDIRKTLIQCFSLNLDQATLYPLEICPGTQISAEATERGVIKPGLAAYLNAQEYPLYATEDLPRHYLLNIKKSTEKVLDKLEELKKTMQEVERQFLPENKRDWFSTFEINETKKLHRLIKECISKTLDYITKYPDEGLMKNGQFVFPVNDYVEKVNKEIDFIENKLEKKYPHYDPYYWDYHTGTLSWNWNHFIKLFNSLFSKDKFL